MLVRRSASFVNAKPLCILALVELEPSRILLGASRAEASIARRKVASIRQGSLLLYRTQETLLLLNAPASRKVPIYHASGMLKGIMGGFQLEITILSCN